MLRKTHISAMACFLAATPCFSGFYAGLSAGPEGAHFTQEAQVTRPGFFDVSDKNHFSGIGVSGSLYGGYGRQRDKLYLAGELNLNLSSVRYVLTNEERIHQSLSKTTFRIRHSAGAGLLPGYFISPDTLLYGRVGYDNGRIRIKESDPTIRSAHKNRSGLRLGLGLRHQLSPKSALRMEYSQIHYQNIKSSVFEPVGGVLKKTTLTPCTAQVAFGWVYAFDAPPPGK